MSDGQGSAPLRAAFPAGKLIYCVLPDDGRDRRLLIALRERYGIVATGSRICRGLDVVAKTKTERRKLPEAHLVKRLHVLCTEGQAEEIFDFIFRFARLDRPGGGMMWQQPVMSCTPYELPPDVPDELR